MTKYTPAKINALIAERVAAGFIFNVDYNDVKSVSGRLLERALDDWRAAYVRHENRTDSLDELSWSVLTPSVLSFPSKKAAKMIAAEQNPAGDAIRSIVADFAPIREGLETLKPQIVKGRKPSTNENARPARTLENTGTCAVCGRNVKRAGAGKLVAHGYRTSHGFKWTGDCLGTAADPIEVSVEGLERLRDAMDRQLQQIIPADAKPATRKNMIEKQEYAAKHLPRIVAAIADWKPGTLPA